MQLVEIALFAAVAALALALIGYAVRPYLRAKRRPTAHQAAADAVLPRRRSSRRVPRPWSALPATATMPRGCGSARTTRASWFRPAIPRRGPRAPAPPARAASAPTTPARGSARSTARSWFRCPSRWGRAIRPAPWPSPAGWEDLPNCSRRYESEATFCGRDGEELVPVNESRSFDWRGVRHARGVAVPARLLPCVLASSMGVV